MPEISKEIQTLRTFFIREKLAIMRLQYFLSLCSKWIEYSRGVLQTAFGENGQL